MASGSLTPQPSIRCLPSALSVFGAIVRAPACHAAVRRDDEVVREDPFFPFRQIASSFWRPYMRAAITQQSFDLCSAPYKARRSAPPTRLPRVAFGP
jgi:hypothetical protein